MMHNKWLWYKLNIFLKDIKLLAQYGESGFDI